jgi:16S rRNA (guanine966-N2)-methyltransferase
VRIVAGRLGGRRLVAPKGLATRPTGDRVKEAWFSKLGSLAGARVLDLYAGTGALGLEALSRGAERVLFVEASPQALGALRANLDALGCTHACDVISGRVERAIEAIVSRGPFDLLIADPPWADVDRAASCIATLARRGAFGSDAIITLEHAASSEPTVDGLKLVERRHYGDTGLSFFELGESDAKDDGAGGP